MTTSSRDGNRFTTRPAPSLVHLEGADRVTVHRNPFAADGPMPAGAVVVRLAHCRDVRLVGNKFDETLLPVRLVAGPDVAGTVGDRP